jgi:Restriction endonuclease
MLIMIKPHLQFLQYQMKSITHMPTLFEYYAAIHLTKQLQTQFYVYRDLPDSHKTSAGFPIQDKGIDVIDATLQHIVQVKYYKKNAIIHYGKLSTFLGSPVLVGRKDLRLTLIRTHHCKLHPDIQKIVKRGDMKDITLCPNQFLQSMKFR